MRERWCLSGVRGAVFIGWGRWIRLSEVDCKLNLLFKHV
jgi:hypothetical protein